MEITRVATDTDILVDVLRNVKTVLEFISSMEREGCILSTTIINAFELYHDAYRSKNKNRVYLQRENCSKD